MHPDFLLEKLSSVQLAEWEAFYRMEPWGCRIEDYRFGTLASILVSPNIKKGHKVPKWDDIFPDYYKDTTKRQSVEEMKSIMMSMVK